MNCAVLSYSLVTGSSAETAHNVLYTALGPFGAHVDTVSRILTRRGWQWLPAGSLESFTTAHPRGRFILTYEGHYCALIDGETIGAMDLPFLGAWMPPS